MNPTPDPGAIEVSDDLLRRAYDDMTTARLLDRAAVAWQRQGILPAFPPHIGQEAAQVGSALAAELPGDLLFPTYREHGVAVAAGVDLNGYFASHVNGWHGGRYNPIESRFMPLQAVVGGGVLHAVGWAMGRAKDGARDAAIAYLGDGASSQGDVHESMNFAAVFGAPVVFFVQNNRWSLSVPLHKQVAGERVAARAAGYGIPALTVDGDDFVEVYRATAAALAFAREHGRPVVVEAMTYRRGPHATSDDPSRYRTLEHEQSAGPDPLDRMRDTLAAHGLADEAWLADVTVRAEARVEAVREYLITTQPTPGSEMFRYVFQESTPQLAAQERQWREESEHA